MAKKFSYTQRTLKYFRESGVMSAVVERFNPYAGGIRPDGKRTGIRQDLFGFVDIIAVGPKNIMAVQSTSGPLHTQHRKKILEENHEEATTWLKAGGKIFLISWSKKKLNRDAKAKFWMPRIEEITLESWGVNDDAARQLL